MSTSRSISELIKVKLEEAQKTIVEPKENVTTEMEKRLVSQGVVGFVEKAQGFTYADAEVDLRVKFLEMVGKIRKLKHQKLQLNEKLESSEKKCEHANQLVEDLQRQIEELQRVKMNMEVNVEAAIISPAKEDKKYADLQDFAMSKKGSKNIWQMTRGCKLETIDIIKANLEKENLEKFEQSCFGHLLKIKRDQLKYQGKLFFHFLLHIDMAASNKARLVFKINNTNIEFGHSEFSLVTWLDDLGTVEEVTTTSSSSIHRDVFHGRSNIQFEDIERVFLDCSYYNQVQGRGELVLKLALLYFLYGTLLGTRYMKTNIDLRYLHLIDDLDKFNAFPWGRVACEFMVSSILAERVRLDDLELDVTNKTIPINVDGFIFALQIWAYEVMPCLATYCASRANNLEEQTPPILRWHAMKFFSFDKLKKFFTPGDEAAHLVLNGIEAYPVKKTRMTKLGEQSMGTIPDQAATLLSSPKQKKRKMVCNDKEDQMSNACDKQSNPTDCQTAEFPKKKDLPGSSSIRLMPKINPDLSIPELIELVGEIQSILMERENSRGMELDVLRVGNLKPDEEAQHHVKWLEDLDADLKKCDAAATEVVKEKQNVKAHAEPAYNSADEGKQLGSSQEPAKENKGKELAVAVPGVMCSGIEVPRWKMESGDHHFNVIVLSDSDDEGHDKSKKTDFCSVESSKKRSKT